MKLQRERNITIAYLADGSIKAAWDLREHQLEEVRQTLLPLLISRTREKTIPTEFTLFDWPPDTSRMDKI